MMGIGMGIGMGGGAADTLDALIFGSSSGNLMNLAGGRGASGLKKKRKVAGRGVYGSAAASSSSAALWVQSCQMAVLAASSALASSTMLVQQLCAA